MAAAGDHRPITTAEIAHATPFYYAEDEHQQYCTKIHTIYCGIGGIGVACRLTRDDDAGVGELVGVENEPSGDFTVAYAILALNLSAHCCRPVFWVNVTTDL